MNAVTAVLPAATEDVLKWSKSKKLAGLLLMLTPENGSRIMKSLEEQELEEVAREMAHFTTLNQETQAQILREFSGLAVEAASSVTCGVERVQTLLENCVGTFRASDIVGRAAPCRAPVAAMQQIVEMDTRHLVAVLRYEQLQTITLVVSYLPPEKASQVLLGLRPESREQVLQRLATLAPASVKVVEYVAEELHRKFGVTRTHPLNQTGGVKVAAQVLNALPRNVSDSILVSLKERNAVLWESIRQKMFTFEELGILEPKVITKILQVIELSTLTVALKTASEGLRSKLLACISKRAAEEVREEIEFSGPLKLREIEAAQLQIMETVRRLESESEIDLDDLRPGSNN